MDHLSAITPIKVGDEFEVDRAKLTETAAMVRKNGVWIELRPGVDPDVGRNTTTLRDLIDQMCASKSVYQGDGPPMAMIRTPPDAAGNVKTFVYESFGTDGIKPQGEVMRGAPDFANALRSSTGAFDAWLQPRRTLVWRTRPEVDRDSTGLWRVYWRCVQIDDGARSIPVDWHF